MLPKICIFLLFTLSTITAAGQKNKKYVISGYVRTSDGKPAEFITIELKNTVYGATSDARGHFEFPAPAGSYTLVAASIVAHRKEFPVTIGPGHANTFPDLRIAEHVNQLEQVVVTGQFSPQSMRNSLYKVRSITRRTIALKAPTNIGQLLNTEIGIRLANDLALGETSFELLGMGGTSIKILLNGLPLIDRGDNHSSLSQIDVNSIERIEIVEGPMSVVYGTDALAGVINIITQRGADDTASSTWRAGARLQEESQGNEYAFFSGEGLHNASVDLGYTHKSGFFVNGGLTRNHNGGWRGDQTGRARRWHPKHQYLANATAGYHHNGFNLWYRLDRLGEEIFGPENPNAGTPEQYRDRNYLSTRYTHQMQAEWKINYRLTLDAALSEQEYERRTRTTVTDESTGEKWLSDGESEQDVTTYRSWTARATAVWIATSQLSFQPGLEYQWTQGQGNRIGGTPEISFVAWFLSAEYKPREWLSLRPGVRSFIFADYHTPAAIPSLLTKFDLTKKLDLRLSYAYGFRTPNIQELYFSFHNTNHDIDGNPHLKAEYSHSLTGSLTWQAVHTERIRLTTSLSGFYNHFKDRIALAENEKIPNFYTYYNADRYKTVGGSLENSIVSGGLRASVNLLLIGRYNRYSESDGKLAEYRFSPELSASISYHLQKSGTDIDLFYKYTGARKEYYYSIRKDKDGVEQSEVYLRGLPGYHQGEIMLTQKITPCLHINAGIKNLFDLTRLRTTSDSENDIPSTSYLGCGRSWSIGLKLLLNGKFKNHSRQSNSKTYKR